MRARLLRVRQFLTTREGAILLGLLAVAIVIRLPLMAFRGYYGDLAQYISWGGLVTKDLGSIYTSLSTTIGSTGGFGGRGGGGFGGGGGGFGGISGYINYPPGTPYLFGALVAIYNHSLLPLNHTALGALIGQNGLGPFFAKIPLLLADVAAVALLYWEARRRRSERFALVVAASWAFSPALLYNGVIWGQTDGFVALPMLLALFALVSERYKLAGVSLALAVLIKPQPVVLAPVVLVYLWRWSKREQFLAFGAAAALTLLIFFAPVLVPHFQLFDMLHNMQVESYSGTSRLTSDAFNFWWLIGYAQQTLASTFLGVKVSLVGDLLFGAVTLAVCAQVWRRREPVYLAFGLALEMFGFFLFMGGQHERYLFFLLPLALAAVVVAPRGAARASRHALRRGDGALLPQHVRRRRGRDRRGGAVALHHDHAVGHVPQRQLRLAEQLPRPADAGDLHLRRLPLLQPAHDLRSGAATRRASISRGATGDSKRRRACARRPSGGAAHAAPLIAPLCSGARQPVYFRDAGRARRASQGAARSTSREEQRT